MDAKQQRIAKPMVQSVRSGQRDVFV